MLIKNIALFLAVITIQGCSTPHSRMDVDDLGMLQLDCSRKEEQLAFLRMHIPSKKERISNGLLMSSILGLVAISYDDTYETHYDIRSGRYENTARILINALNEKCRSHDHKVQQCTTLNETFTHGASHGASCTIGGVTTSRWETQLDD